MIISGETDVPEVCDFDSSKIRLSLAMSGNTRRVSDEENAEVPLIRPSEG